MVKWKVPRILGIIEYGKDMIGHDAGNERHICTREGYYEEL